MTLFDSPWADLAWQLNLPGVAMAVIVLALLAQIRQGSFVHMPILMRYNLYDRVSASFSRTVVQYLDLFLQIPWLTLLTCLYLFAGANGKVIALFSLIFFLFRHQYLLALQLGFLPLKKMRCEIALPEAHFENWGKVLWALPVESRKKIFSNHENSPYVQGRTDALCFFILIIHLIQPVFLQFISFEGWQCLVIIATFKALTPISKESSGLTSQLFDRSFSVIFIWSAATLFVSAYPNQIFHSSFSSSLFAVVALLLLHKLILALSSIRHFQNGQWKNIKREAQPSAPFLAATIDDRLAENELGFQNSNRFLRSLWSKSARLIQYDNSTALSAAQVMTTLDLVLALFFLMNDF